MAASAVFFMPSSEVALHNLERDVVNAWVLAFARAAESEHDGIVVEAVEPRDGLLDLRIDKRRPVDVDLEMRDAVLLVEDEACIGSGRRAFLMRVERNAARRFADVPFGSLNDITRGRFDHLRIQREYAGRLGIILRPSSSGAPARYGDAQMQSSVHGAAIGTALSAASNFDDPAHSASLKAVACQSALTHQRLRENDTPLKEWS